MGNGSVKIGELRGRWKEARLTLKCPAKSFPFLSHKGTKTQRKGAEEVKAGTEKFMAGYL